MYPKIVYWKRFNYTEVGYKLIEVSENGQLLQRTFKRNTKNEEFFEELESKTIQLKGKINLEKIQLDSDYCVLKSEFKNRLELLSTYSLDQWTDARDRVVQLQNDSENDLTVDYHTVLVIDPASMNDELSEQFERFEFPIVKFRFNFNDDCFQRRKYAAYSAVEFSPTINEKLYFHYIPESQYLTMTGDDLFALHTETVKDRLSEEGFVKYIQTRKADVEKNNTFYRTLIIQQRERRAMLETEVIGDLYPR